jgi:hypothetical protein
MSHLTPFVVPASVTKKIEEVVTKAIKQDLGTPTQIAEILLVLANDIDRETVERFSEGGLGIHRGKLVYPGPMELDGERNIPYIQKIDGDYYIDHLGEYVPV